MNHCLLCSEDATSNNYIQLPPQGENVGGIVIDVILAPVDEGEPIIVSDGGENDLRPSSPPPSNPPSTSQRLRHIPAAIALNYVWRNWWEDGEVEAFEEPSVVECGPDDVQMA